MVSFNQIPNDVLTPLALVEFDSSRAQQGPSVLSYRALIIGQKIGTGTAAANSLHKVTSADQVATLAGRGSQLHRQAKAWFRNNKSTETWIGVLDDASAAVAASGTLTVTGPATAAGTVYLYVAGERLPVAVASGDAATAIAAAIAAAIGVHASGTVTMGTPTTSSDVTVGSIEFVGTAGAVTPGDPTYSIDGGTTAAAASLAAQINAHATTKALVKASASDAVCTIRAIAGGTAGNAIALTTDDATHATVSGSGTLAGGAAGLDEDLPVHASVSGAVVTLHAKNAGPQGNDIDVRLNYQDGEALPTGVAVAKVAMASGATAPTLTSLITAMGDRWFHVLTHPYTDATSLSALEAELASRAGPMRSIDGLAITSAAGAHATLTTLSEGRNSQFNVILTDPSDAPLTPPCELAAMAAAVVAYYGAIDPARPFQTLTLDGAKAPAEGDWFTNSERNLLLKSGAATTKVGPGGVVQIERLVTTYRYNAAGSPDTAYRDANTVLTLQFLRYDFRSIWPREYPRHKLANDGVRVAAGQAVLTPKLAKARAVAWFQAMEEMGLVEGIDQFKRDLVVVRNSSDVNRLDFLLPPDLMNQLVVTAAQAQFRL
jgi:phage tail sheath gpL-like